MKKETAIYKECPYFKVNNKMLLKLFHRQIMVLAPFVIIRMLCNIHIMLDTIIIISIQSTMCSMLDIKAQLVLYPIHPCLNWDQIINIEWFFFY